MCRVLLCCAGGLPPSRLVCSSCSTKFLNIPADKLQLGTTILMAAQQAEAPRQVVAAGLHTHAAASQPASPAQSTHEPLTWQPTEPAQAGGSHAALSSSHAGRVGTLSKAPLLVDDEHILQASLAVLL